MTQKPIWQKQIPRERIEILFSEAEKAFRQNPERASNYVRQAWNIALRCRVRIPTALKRKFCKKCYSYLAPGISSEVRLNEQKIIITCKNCGDLKRIPYKPIKDKKPERKGNK